MMGLFTHKCNRGGHEKHTLNWEPVENILKMATLDVLVILDCCYAGNRPERRFRPQDKQDLHFDGQSSKEKDNKRYRKFEVLCAAGAAKETLGFYQGPPSEGSPSTFTEALIWALEQLANGSTFTTAVLLQTLFSKPEFPVNQYPVLWKDGPTDQPYIAMAAGTRTFQSSQVLERAFDLRFHVVNRPNESQLRSLTKALMSMSEAGIFTPREIEWIGFSQEDNPSKDINIEDAIDFKLFDSFVESGTTDGPRSGRADDWIARVKQISDRLPGSKYPIKFDGQPEPDLRRVKVAIIDTGFDSQHPLFKWVPNHTRDNEHKSFVWVPTRRPKEMINESPGHDSSGHGTHNTSIMNMVAPMAEIYVAKIVDGEKYREKMADSVAAAINYACNEWKADIITMSLGFPYPTKELQEAIKKAGRSTLMFASASNDGANRDVPITYPAREEGIFCIHSTDTYGKASQYTPFPQDCMDNFTTLGESVRAAWPTHLGMGLEQRMSGISTASPIAVAIAALILQFAFNSNGISEIEREKIKTYHGMRSVLLNIAKPAGGYRYLNPVEYFQWQEGKEGDMSSQLSRTKQALATV